MHVAFGLRRLLVKVIGLVGGVRVAPADLCEFASSRVGVQLRAIAIAGNRWLLLRRRLSPFFRDVGPLPLIQILQVPLDLLLLQKVVPRHFVLGPLLPRLSLLDLLKELALVLVLLGLLDLVL